MKFRLVNFLPPPVARAATRLIGDQRGAVALTYALLLVTMLLALGMGMDLSNALQSKYRLDLAADAAAVACGETWESYIVTGYGANGTGVTTTAQYTSLLTAANTAAQTRGLAVFASQAAEMSKAPYSATPSVIATQPAPTLQTTGPSVVCNSTYTGTSATYLTKIAGFTSMGISGAAQSQVDLAPFIQVFLVLDTSASMMVGSTPNDQQAIASWISTNDAKYASNDPNRVLCLGKGCGDNYPCAFACHEEPAGTDFTVRDMQWGLANAHNPAPGGAGATTRFDVMRRALNNDKNAQFCSTTASGNNVVCGTTTTDPDCNNTSPSNAEGLFAHIRDCFPTNSLDSLQTISYGLFGFNEGINGNYAPTGTGGSGIFNGPVTVGGTTYTDNSQLAVVPTKTLSTIAAGVNQITIGLNTHLMPPAKTYSKTSNSVLQDLVDIFSGTTNSAYPFNPYGSPLSEAGLYATTNTSIPGTTANNPLKFIIILTDGMSSDRNWDWCNGATMDITNCNNDPWPAGSLTKTTNNGTICTNWASSPLFDGQSLYPGAECNNNGYKPNWLSGGGSKWSVTTTPVNPTNTQSTTYDSAIDVDGVGTYAQSGNFAYTQSGKYAGQSFCTQLKNSGKVSVTVGGVAQNYNAVTVAVLETPYTPMNGQDPAIFPFEGGVQQTIYPNGPANGSALSAALQACATPSTPTQQYYFQAISDSSIASGFITLFDSFVGQYVHLTQ